MSNKNVLNRKHSTIINVNGHGVFLDALNDKVINTLYEYVSNPSACCNKPFKTSKSLDGNLSFKGYYANKFFSAFN